MRKLIILCLCSAGLTAGLFAQGPNPPPPSPPAGVSSPSAVASPSASAESDLADQIHKRIDKKFKQRGVHFTIGDEDSNGNTKGSGSHGADDIPEMVVPLVAIIFLTVFSAPVLIVAVIMYFGFSKNRMQHRTIRMLVEKGQPVPAALLAPPAPAQRQRSDMRRGVVLVMVGLGLMLFFAAVNDWEGGSWALGVIPFLIGAGYLLVWKLEGGNKPKTDNPPPLP